MGLFRKKTYIKIPSSWQVKQRQEVVPDGLWEKCLACGRIIYIPELTEYKICPHCHYYFKLTAYERIHQLVDKQTFTPYAQNIAFSNPLDFPNYEQKINALQQQGNSDEAVTVGFAKINQIPVGIGVMDAHFIMGSMGYIVGERLTRLFEEATRQNLPVVLFCASGGARMQEGIHSLMQMAKVSMAVANHAKKGLFYLSILTNPTMGGVTASFAMEADIILAEPNATIGFAGKRVIEQTIKEKVADDFQSSENVQTNGFIDSIVEREDLSCIIGKLLHLHAAKEEGFGDG